MTHRARLIAAVLAAGLALPTVAVGAGTAADAAGAGTGQPTAAARLSRDLRATQLLGMDVRNTQGEDVGEIKDLVLDLERGQVHYVVLELGGFLGMGAKLLAFPLRAFDTSRERDELVLDVPRVRLEHAPGFARDNWPDWGTYLGQVDRHFEAGLADRPGRPAPRAEESVRVRDRLSDEQVAARYLGADPRGPRYRTASDAIGMRVLGAASRKTGDIEDIVVNMGTGRIRYFVLELDRAGSPNDRRVTLPPDALTFADRSAIAVLRAASAATPR